MTGYDYHPKDAEYIKSTGLHWISYYTSKIAVCHRIGAHCWVDGVKRAYAKTKSLDKAGKILGVSAQCIDNHLRRLGVPKNKKGGPNHVRSKKVQGAVCQLCLTAKKYKSGHCVECMRRCNERKRELCQK